MFDLIIPVVLFSSVMVNFMLYVLYRIAQAKGVDMPEVYYTYSGYILFISLIVWAFAGVMYVIAG